jgi:TetR/AcrR family transcriptional regulator, tetracycline repressor protein
MSLKASSPRQRGRPARATLDRERVILQALTILDREGPEAITIRRLADRLGVSPMAIYNHVASKKDLVEGVAAHIVSRIDFSSRSSEWRKRVCTCFRRLRQGCLRHPNVIPLLEGLDVAPLAVFTPMEITLSALGDAGVSAGDALKAFYTLMNFTMGQISYEVRGPFKALDPASLSKYSLQKEEFANIRRAVVSKQWDFDEAFEFGLSVILAGLDAPTRSLRMRR